LIGRGKAASRNFLESSAELLKRDIDRQHVHHSRHPGTNYASVESHVSDVQLMLIWHRHWKFNSRNQRYC